jgi:hypothetical protein
MKIYETRQIMKKKLFIKGNQLQMMYSVFLIMTNNFVIAKYQQSEKPKVKV